MVMRTEYGSRYLSVELCQDRVRLRLNRIYSIEPIVRTVNRYINHGKRKEQLPPALRRLLSFYHDVLKLRVIRDNYSGADQLAVEINSNVCTHTTEKNVGSLSGPIVITYYRFNERYT